VWVRRYDPSQNRRMNDEVMEETQLSPSTTTTELVVVLPGEDVTDIVSSSSTGKSKSPKIGRGLVYDSLSNRVVVTHAGRLAHRKSSNTFMVTANTKRYIPASQDRVIGVVEERFGDYYRCNIFAPHFAFLPILAFEGASKRNKPNLLAGSTVYCRVISAPSDADPELSCKVAGNSDGGAAMKDWLTGECTYGELKGGTSIQISIGLARSLLNPNNVVLDALGKSLSFETAVGVNGVVWVNSKNPEHIILVCNAIKNSEVLTPEQTRGMVRSLLSTALSKS